MRKLADSAVTTTIERNTAMDATLLDALCGKTK
jgi:hypothetical protein